MRRNTAMAYWSIFIIFLAPEVWCYTIPYSLQYSAKDSAGHCMPQAGGALVLDGSGDGSGPGTFFICLKWLIRKAELITTEIKWSTEKYV